MQCPGRAASCAAAQSGMWALSVSNDFIGNRFIGHEEAFFTQTSAFPHGRGAAQGRCAAAIRGRQLRQPLQPLQGCRLVADRL